MTDYKLHPFIVISLYKELIKRYGERGAEIITHATRVYGAQRGSRMAARALRDGVINLNFAAYLAYMETGMPADVLKVDLSVKNGYLIDSITKCPWNEEWIKNDCLECGRIFCREIDIAVIHGMNPSLAVRQLEIMPETGRCLLHLIHDDINSGFFEEVGRLKKCAKGPTQVSHEYLTANLWYSYFGTLRNILADESFSILENIKNEMREKYGQRLIDSIESFAGTDFDSIL